MINQIFSNRFFNNQPYMQIVYEWEDEIGKLLNVPIQNSEFGRPLYEKIIYNRYTSKLISNQNLVDAIQKLNEIIGGTKNSLCFEIYPKSSFLNNRGARANSIPVIIDFWKYENLENFARTYKNCNVVYITSLEVFNYLKEKEVPINIKHLPISLPTKYKGLTDKNYKRSIDIVLAGRQSDVLMDYLKEFCSKYKDVTYVFQTVFENKIFYKSNRDVLSGQVETRQQYFDLLKSGTISFYSTPGMDEGSNRTGGFNPVTPRFLELLAAKCLLLGRYPDTEETQFFEMSKVCPNFDTYEQFENILEGYLNQDIANYDFHEYERILGKHYTSERICQLQNNHESE